MVKNMPDNPIISRLEARRRLYEKHLEYSITLVRDAIRGAFLLNGAAVTAILASQDIKNFKWAISCFALGALFAVVTSCVAYIYQRFVADSWEFSVQGKPKVFTHETRWFIFGSVCFASSLLSCIAGILFSYYSIV